MEILSCLWNSDPNDLSLTTHSVSEANVPVIMDVGGQDVPLSPEIFPYLEVLSPNETELARMTKMRTETREEVIEAAKSLIKQGIFIPKQCIRKMVSLMAVLIYG